MFEVGASAGGEDGSVSLLDHWFVLRRRRWVLAATVLAVLLAGAALTFIQVPLYRASTTLIVEADIPEVAKFTGITALSQTREFYETQYAILRSDKILRRAFEACALGRDPEYARLARPIERFRRHVFVEPIPDSRLVRIGVDHRNRQTAVELATAMAQMYIDHSLEDRQAASRSAFDWLSKQIEIARDKLEASETQLLEYKDKEEVVSLERRQVLLEERLASLGEKHNAAIGRRQELSTTLSEVAKLRSNPDMVDSLPRSLESTLAQSLKTNLSQLQVQLAKIVPRYKAKHPDIVSLQNQIEALRSALQREAGKTQNSIEIELSIARANEATINASLDVAKQDAMRVAQQSIRFHVLEREASSNRQIYDVLLQRLREVDVGGSVGGQNVRVLDTADAGDKPYKPRPLVNLLVALVVGVAMGVALCFLVEQVDNTVTSEGDVAQYLHEPVVGIVPRQKKTLKAAAEQDSTVALAYADVRTKLKLHMRDHVLKTLVVTSAVKAEGKTVSSIAIASGFAQPGSNVLLIDVDLYQASCAKRLGMQQKTGLSDYFLQDTDPQLLIRATKIPHLYLLPAGLIPPNPGECLGSPRLQTLLDTVKGDYSLVVLDCPPVTATLNVAMVGALADGVVVAVRAGSTPRPLVKKVLAQLKGARGSVLGVVLTMVDAKRDGSYYSYYGYGYGGAQHAASRAPKAPGKG